MKRKPRELSTYSPPSLQQGFFIANVIFNDSCASFGKLFFCTAGCKTLIQEKQLLNVPFITGMLTYNELESLLCSALTPHYGSITL
jgi:hypothetical protein